MSVRRDRVLSRLAAGCVVGALTSSGCAIQPNDHTLPGQTAVGDDGYTVTVRFDQIENLVPNSTVLKDNVVIGTVASIDTADWEAVVELRLLHDTPLSKDAVFSIGQKTLLGAQYVEVVVPPKPSESKLADGDVVPVEQTGTYPATEQVLGAVALLLNNGGLSQISTITGELSTAFKGRVPDTRGLIRHAKELLAVLDSNRDEIVSALEALDSLSAGLRNDQDLLFDAIDRINPGLRVLEEERERLVNAVTDTSRTSNRAVRVVQASEPALLANLDALGPILTNLGRVSESLPEALKMGLTIPWPAMTTRDAIRGDYFNQFTTLDLRDSTLADTWLGGLPPALQAGDPIEDPLTLTEDDDDPGGGLGDDLDDLLLPGPDRDRDNADPSGCLLSALGLC
ncbi:MULTISPECIES: MCE family protein [Nocardioides]|uniref:MCE family protein n=1 Tax=Nocardioides vastitatis TaxID=2568655 RepID=A0ABW0ZN70_9ACTN|nr:MCE family protein [Nocardioides sp.]THJ16028.1 MCE family protein [Nocardioides sp.]